MQIQRWDFFSGEWGDFSNKKTTLSDASKCFVSAFSLYKKLF